MKRIIYELFLLILSVASGYGSFLYLNGKYELIGIFFSGLVMGVLLMYLRLNIKNDKINSYKRELEKESITSDESNAKIKVLESKIEVLEKALENALNK